MRILYVLLFFAAFVACKSNKTSEKQNKDKPKFDFGTHKVASGFTAVTSNNLYNDTTGYGFDYQTIPKFVKRKTRNALIGDFCTDTKPFFFSVKLPEGHYTVTVYLGDAKGNSQTTIKAENRRLMLHNVQTRSKEVQKYTFTVNVRTPVINDSLSIRLNTREYAFLNWDDKLTLEFCDSLPCICGLEIEPFVPEKVLYIAGNSTVTDQPYEPWAAWGQMITYFFSPEISVANYAESGESLHSFYHKRRLQKVLNLVKPGDYVFIEFGHNDQKRKGPGIGPWESYTEYLHTYIAETRIRDAIPVLVTPMHRRNFNDQGQVINTLGDYPAAIRKVAKEKKVALIDLHEMSKKLYEALGPEKSKKAFCHYPANTYPNQSVALADNTHFNNYGAYLISLCILRGILENKLELTSYLYDNYTIFDPKHPLPFAQCRLPESAFASNVKQEGDEL